jgi:imidazoleglycerol-phosphate dehydratase
MRLASIARKTAETDIQIKLNLDGSGLYQVATGIGFLDHMLELFARHALIDLDVKAVGDLHVDFHHTTEDVGICIGQALDRALADRRGVKRYGSATIPMDEALTRVSIDLSGRPCLVWKVAFPRSTIGNFDAELLREWFQALVLNARMTLHIENFHGDNMHHIAESSFKALARALRQAVAIDDRQPSAVPSTKGTL